MKPDRGGLAVVETHPIQYHAPVYRVLQAQFDIPVTAIYGSDFSVVGYRDKEFGATFAWDTDLLSGYTSLFLSRVSSARPPFVPAVSPKRVGRALREVAPRAVLIQGYSPHFHRVAFFETRRAGYPVLFRSETTDHARRRSFFKRWIRSQALRWIYRRCTRLLYIGRRSYEHFKHMGCPDEKLIFSPYCVDLSPFQWDEASRAVLRPAVRKGLGIAEQDQVLLFSGKLSFRKGPDLILQAAKRLSPKLREKIAVLFLGSGELRSQLDALAKTPPLIRAHFLGFQNQAHLSSYYHAADLLILPSRHSETWGLVVNEALHHGLACVVSIAVGCTPDLVHPGTTGEVCEADSVESLKLAVERAMSLVGRAKIRENCRREISGYTVQKAAEGIAEAFRAVTGP